LNNGSSNSIGVNNQAVL